MPETLELMETDELCSDELALLYRELTVHFQPIYSTRLGKVFGYEALARHKNRAINIKNLFLMAKKSGFLFELDMLCRRNAIQEASRQNLNGYLFINICPESLLVPKHEIGLTDKFAEEFKFPKERIILEITEETAIENYELFFEGISYYKSRGYKIAIDDFGAGFGGPKLFSMIKPWIVKIDRYFIQTLEDNFISRSFVDYTISVCQQLGIMVVAEGIETQIQLQQAIKFGADLLQGYYLGKPKAEIALLSETYAN